MIGVFDSGAGGRAALSRLRQKLPEADIAFFADTENAPYGTKSKRELRALVTADIRRLRAFGAGKILIACCTAGTVWDTLDPEVRAFTYPILTPTATAALGATRSGRIGILATDATVRAGAFSDRLAPYHVLAVSAAAQRLVPLVEAGHTAADDPDVLRAVTEATKPFANGAVDTLILGCTHFPALAPVIGAVLPGVTLISSVAEGTDDFLSRLTVRDTEGEGKTYEL